MIVMIPLMQLVLFGYAINTTPRHLPTAVLLQETQRRRPLDPARRWRTPTISRSRIRSASEAEFDRLLASGEVLFAVEIPRRFRARAAARRPAGAAGRGRRDRSGRGRRGAGGARRICADRAAQRARAPGRRAAPPFEIRRMRATTRRATIAAQHRAGPGRHHPDHDHADLHRAVGDARDRARHDGKPAGDADHAGRDHARQDRALCAGRLHAGGADRRRGRRRCSACRSSAAWRCWRRCRTLFIAPICRSATPSRPSRRTSCRRCRCR